jgi:hypothetical protein
MWCKTNYSNSEMVRGHLPDGQTRHGDRCVNVALKSPRHINGKFNSAFSQLSLLNHEGRETI